MIIDDGKKKSSIKSGKIYKSFDNLSERMGSIIYGEMDISKLVKKYIKSKIPKPAIKKLEDEKISDMILSYIEREKNTRKMVGMGVLSIIILFAAVMAVYMVNIVISALFEIVPWWILALVMIGTVVPLTLVIAYMVAKGDY